MNPQERQLVDDLFDRLAKVESAPRDADASAAIADGLRKAPNATYALVQTVLVQDEALKRAAARIEELEQGQAGAQPQSGGFLDSMRDTIFGKEQRGSVPNVPPPASNRPVWNSGQVLQQGQGQGHYDQGHYDQGGYGQGGYGQGGYGQGGGHGQGGGYGGGYGQGGFGGPGGGFGSPFGGGGSFLGTAAAAAAGMVGGSLLMNGIRGMMGGGHHQSLADAGGSSSGGGSPWSDQSGSSLARDAGINDIGRSDGGSRSGLFDQAELDRQQDAEQDAMDDFGNDDDSDYA
jgi:uncharacterized protein